MKKSAAKRPPKADAAALSRIIGYGCSKHFPLRIDPRIDLSKPTYEQVLKLDKIDARKRRRRA